MNLSLEKAEELIMNDIISDITILNYNATKHTFIDEVFNKLLFIVLLSLCIYCYVFRENINYNIMYTVAISILILVIFKILNVVYKDRLVNTSIYNMRLIVFSRLKCCYIDDRKLEEYEIKMIGEEIIKKLEEVIL